jgi:NAD(P)H-quinone oxidoreductase subunit 5
MTHPLVFLSALGPLALLAAALAPGDISRACALSRLAAAAALLAAALSALAVARLGPLSSGTLGVAGIGLALKLDALSAGMAILVAFIGLIVVSYSQNYLDGEPGHARFMRALSATLAGVLLFILSGNMAQLWLAWIGASFALHRLLLFYPHRQTARLAARKKWIVSRLGDACLLAAMVVAYRGVGSLDYDAVLAAPLPAVAVLVTLAALLKSAQFPSHGWLVEVMETPTPVSALLHAGVINAGGVLVLRFSPLIAHSEPALLLLTIVGGVTALFGSMAMLPQTSVKVSLAFSTVAQMGFMMLECGLGAYSAAALHIVAHSLYKAHAFLSSGSVIDIARAAWTPRLTAKPHPARLALAIAAALALVAVGAAISGETAAQPGVLSLAAVLALGLVPLLANAFDEQPDVYVIARSLGVAAMLVASYFVLQRISAAVFADALAPASTLGPLGWLALALVILAFAGLTLLQAILPRLASSPFWQALYAHTANGFYLNTYLNRWILRAWPAGSAFGG